DRRARHRVADRERDRLDRLDAMLRHELLDPRPLSRCDAREDDVLLRSQPDLRADLIDDAAQAGARAHVTDVGDAPVLDVDADIEVAVALLVPAEVVVHRLPAQRLSGLARGV